MRIATGALRPRNDRGFTRGAVQNRRADRGVRPYGGQQEVRLGGAMWWGAAPTDVLQGVRGKWRIYRGVAGGGATGRKLLA